MSSPTNDEAIGAALAKLSNIPSGVTAAFLRENRDQPAIIAILAVGAIVLVFACMRCWARVYIVRDFGIDDWLVLASLLPYYAFIALCIVLIHLGSGRHFAYIQYVLSNETINETEVLDFAAHMIYTTALLACRMSGLAFYARIVGRHNKLTWSIRVAAGFFVAAFVPQVFLILFHCLPVTGLWPYAFQPEVDNYKCLQWGAVYVTNSVISVVCDLVLFAIPVAIIYSLRMSLRRKIQLSLVLMPGLLVIGISLTRMYLVIIGQWNEDESWSYNPLLAIEVSEVGSTVIALCVPALKPLFGSVFEHLDRTFVSASSKDRSRTGRQTNRCAGRSANELLSLPARSGPSPTSTKHRNPSVQSFSSERPIVIQRHVDSSISHDHVSTVKPA